MRSLSNIPAGLGVELWFYKVLTILLGGVMQKCGDIVGREAVETYLVRALSSELIVRTCQNSLPSEWHCSESL